MKRGWLVFVLLLNSLTVRAAILRSAGLYYAPAEQIEVNTNFGYSARERRANLYQATSAITIAGARFEHGINDQVSWGATLNYASGDGEIKNSTTTTAQTYHGFFDPEFALKYHKTFENLRLHSNGLFRLKSDAMNLGFDGSPINFSTGGSSLAIQLGLEGALGPLLLGTDLVADLWKDSQELVQRTSSSNSWSSDLMYTREGGKSLATSLFVELNNLKNFKPGLRLRLSQTEAHTTELKSNQQLANSSIANSYRNPSEQGLGASFYGRVRLPKHFVINFEVFANETYINSSLDQKLGQNVGVFSNLGYKF